MTKLAADTIERMKAALDDDLNTAQAQAAIFEMVRAANAAIDAGEMRKDDVAPLLARSTSSMRSSPCSPTMMRRK